ncbi:MAG: NAD(P)-binding protein [Caldilineaceae bacterium]|nr:NAD(P)-binding protein [Caldilineaceae bacterium]
MPCSRQPEDLSAAVVGAGTNGLSAAISLRAAGVDVTLFEARKTLGGGVRLTEGPLPGIRRDVCSSVYPMGMASPVFGAMDLDRFGLEWVSPPIPFAHPLDDGSAVVSVVDRDFPDAVGEDASAWQAAVGPVSDHWQCIADRLLVMLCTYRSATSSRRVCGRWREVASGGSVLHCQCWIRSRPRTTRWRG